MPANKRDYPPDWKTIAFNIKEKANWTCQECGRPCRKIGVQWSSFIIWLSKQSGSSRWIEETFDKVWESGIPRLVERPQRFTLTVAHLDHTPMNCTEGNLKALCSSCHLRYDKFHHAKNASATRAKKKAGEGQLKLLIPFEPSR